MLEILREADAQATFFLAGEQVERRPALAAEIVAAGHRVELHCHRHRNQLRLTPRMLLEDAERGRAAIEEATGQAIADYRPPYGIFSAAGLRAVRARGWRPVLWSKWGRDWDRRATPRLDHASRDRRRPRRGHRPPARRRLLQRARLLGRAPRQLCRRSSRAAGGAGAEVEAAAPLRRRRERPLIAAGESFVEQLGHRARGADPDRRSAWTSLSVLLGGVERMIPQPVGRKICSLRPFGNACSFLTVRTKSQIGSKSGRRSPGVLLSEFVRGPSGLAPDDAVLLAGQQSTVTPSRDRISSMGKEPRALLCRLGVMARTVLSRGSGCPSRGRRPVPRTDHSARDGHT